MLRLKQTVHNLFRKIFLITYTHKEHLNSPGVALPSSPLAGSPGMMRFALKLLILTIGLIVVTSILSLWLLMLWMWMKLHGLWRNIEPTVLNVPYTSCRWVDAVKSTVLTRDLSQSSQLSGDGDIRPGSMSTSSETPGEPKLDDRARGAGL